MSSTLRLANTRVLRRAEGVEGRAVTLSQIGLTGGDAERQPKWLSGAVRARLGSGSRPARQ